MANRLAFETSPYLLQHAENPVDWHSWSEDTLALAQSQNKPILLSVGYSACHWCHVMAHESFEDPATAAVMNEYFINIKVDREERPDIDQIYQAAHALMTQRSGGWPLTMFLTPDQVPFYGGTYFPPTARYNLPGFTELLLKVAEAYRERRHQIKEQSQTLIDAMTRPLTRRNVEMPDATAVQDGIDHLARAFDRHYGGFGSQPKFPNEPDWVLFLRVAPGDTTAHHMVQLTLNSMAKGGIYDHLGGGFCRYSVDDHWEIPHFEKMLYNNGQLLSLYADGWLLMKEPRWQAVVEETVGWMLREMSVPEGGFYSSLDADSEGQEGRFYVWSRDEPRHLLTTEEFALAAPYYGLDGTPNFEHSWHLRVTENLEEVASKTGVPLAQAQQLLASARAKLLAARSERARPGLDDKVLTSWNALAIKGLARAGRVFDRPEWIAIAQRAVDFIKTNLWANGRLLATCKDGKAHLNAYLDDHAFLLDALLELLPAAYRQSDLEFAVELADALLSRYEDKDGGGFFFTSHDHELLIQRPKSPHDNAIPSGNGIAAFALQRLGHLLGETRYLHAAERTLRAFSADIVTNPAACPSLLCALQEWLSPPTSIVLRGEENHVLQWQRDLSSRFLPHCLILALPGALKTGFETLDKKAGSAVNAYVCKGVECLPAIENLNDLYAEI